MSNAANGRAAIAHQLGAIARAEGRDRAVPPGVLLTDDWLEGYDEAAPPPLPAGPIPGGKTAVVRGKTVAIRQPPGRCSDCRFSGYQQPDIVCLFAPPQVTIVMVPIQGPAGQQGFAPQSLAGFPVVLPDMGCWKFQAEPGSAVKAP